MHVYWIPLAIVSCTILLLVTLLRHHSNVQIKTIFFSLAFGADKKSLKPQRTQAKSRKRTLDENVPKPLREADSVGESLDPDE